MRPPIRPARVVPARVALDSLLPPPAGARASALPQVSRHVQPAADQSDRISRRWHGFAAALGFRGAGLSSFWYPKTKSNSYVVPFESFRDWDKLNEKKFSTLVDPTGLCSTRS